MEFKKCKRCGCFFASSNDVCCNCYSKDMLEISTLKNYIEENNLNEINSLSSLSFSTGISQKNLSRYMNNQNFPDININL